MILRGYRCSALTHAVYANQIRRIDTNAQLELW